MLYQAIHTQVVFRVYEEENKVCNYYFKEAWRAARGVEVGTLPSIYPEEAKGAVIKLNFPL